MVYWIEKMNNLYFGNKSCLLPKYRFNYTDIAESKLHIEILRDQFVAKEHFYVSDLKDFYKSQDPKISDSAISWRIRTLVNKNIIQRVGYGVYALGEINSFIPTHSEFQKKIYHAVRKDFPYSDLCIWNTSIFNEFMTHLPFQFYTIVEADAISMTNIFYNIQNRVESVFMAVDSHLLDRYSHADNQTTIVKTLVTEAPTQQVEEITTVTLEKALVDLICDIDLFSAYQGKERNTIFKEAFNKYTVNQNKLFRYAARRGKSEELEEYLKKLQVPVIATK